MPLDKHSATEELLSSDRLGSMMALAYNLPTQALPDDPSWIWENIRWNPWLAMAVYDDILDKDAMVSSCIATRIDGVMAKPRTVLPASNKRQDVRLAEFIDETLHNFFDHSEGSYFGFDNFVYEALDAVFKGVSIGEIIFGEAADRIFIRDVKFKPQHLFSFGDTGTAAYSNSTYQYPQTGPLRLRSTITGGAGLPDGGLLPEYKFFVHSYRPRYSNRWGSALALKIYWASWMKRAAAKQWLRYIEKGSGSTVARYPDGASEAEQTRALEAAQAISEEPSVAIPNKFLIEVLEHVRNVGNVHEAFVDNFCNSEIARAILGQTLTSRGSDGGGSRALGAVHNEVRGEKVEADAKSLMYAINTRIIFPLTLLNAGAVSRPPMYVIKYDPQQDLSATSVWLGRLWEMGLPIKKSYIFNNFQLPETSADDEDVLPPPPMGEQKGLSLPSTGVDAAAFAEKKTLLDGRSNARASRSDLKLARFGRLRPSAMPPLSE